MAGKLESYVIIARAFVRGGLSAPDFETVFLSVFRAEGDRFSPQVAAAIQDLFSAVDAFCEDPAIRDERDIDEGGLLAAAASFLEVVDVASNDT